MRQHLAYIHNFFWGGRHCFISHTINSYSVCNTIVLFLCTYIILNVIYSLLPAAYLLAIGIKHVPLDPKSMKVDVHEMKKMINKKTCMVREMLSHCLGWMQGAAILKQTSHNERIPNVFLLVLKTRSFLFCNKSASNKCWKKYYIHVNVTACSISTSVSSWGDRPNRGSGSPWGAVQHSSPCWCLSRRLPHPLHGGGWLPTPSLWFPCEGCYKHICWHAQGIICLCESLDRSDFLKRCSHTCGHDSLIIIT